MMLEKIHKTAEQALKTDIRYLARGGAWTVGGRIFASSLSLFLAVLYGRYITKDLYGSYSFVRTLLDIAIAFTLPGLATPLLYAIARGKEGAFKKIVRLRFCIGYGVSIILWGYALYVLRGGNINLALALFAGGALMPLYETSNHFLLYLNAKKEFKRRVKANAVVKVSSTIFTIIAIALIYFEVIPEQWHLGFLVSAALIGVIIPQLFYLRSVWREIPEQAETERHTLRDGARFTLLSLPDAIVDKIDNIILFGLLSPGAVAIYAFATAPQEQLRGILKSMSILATPKLANQSLSDMQKHLPGKVLRIGIVLLCISVLYYFTAPTIFGTLFPKYQEAIFYSQIFMFSLVFYPGVFFINALASTKHVRSLALEATISSATELILLLALTYYYGILGTVMTAVIRGIVSVTLLYFLFMRPIKEKEYPAF